MSASANVFRLLGALLLCAAASVAVVMGGPPAFRLLAIGLFVLAAPGLVLITTLRIRDPLLVLVIGMVAGPSGWALLATFAAFTGYWWPGPTVVAVAVVIAVAALALLAQSLRTGFHPLDGAQHRFAAHQADQVVLRLTGKHRGSFPSPYAGDHDRMHG